MSFTLSWNARSYTDWGRHDTDIFLIIGFTCINSPRWWIALKGTPHPLFYLRYKYVYHHYIRLEQSGTRHIIPDWAARLAECMRICCYIPLRPGAGSSPPWIRKTVSEQKHTIQNYINEAVYPFIFCTKRFIVDSGILCNKDHWTRSELVPVLLLLSLIHMYLSFADQAICVTRFLFGHEAKEKSEEAFNGNNETYAG